MKIGFSIESDENLPETAAVTLPVSDIPAAVRSLVQVRFEDDGRVLTYYNDLFALSPGDRVFVSGKLAGKPGTVESVTTRFKINLANYEKVISLASMEVAGTYERIIDKMVSYDPNAISPARFRSWCRAPRPEDEEFVFGDGYELDLSDITASEDIDKAVFDRAIDYCRNGNVAYLSISGGIGTAFVKGTEWYEVNFRYDDGLLVEMYCECPYPGLCKHLLAVAITLEALAKNGLDMEKDFVIVDDAYFWRFVSKGVKKITL